MTVKWNYVTPTSEQQRIANELVAGGINSAPVARLLAHRGIGNYAEAMKFFHPSLSDLHDPFLMPNMDKAVDRLNRAMGRKERIMVYGDYDVDGTTAVALVYSYIRSFYSNLEYYIPTRYEEGYGISIKSIDYAASQGVSLIIVLDCGIKAIDEIAYAKSKGIDFIICDHHVPDDVLPDAVAILNPKLEDSTYPYSDLSGCGVGYKLMQAFAISNGLIAEGENLEQLLDLVAVSIAADIVPMTGENRILTYYGLRRINVSPNLGLKAIIRICNLAHKEITISDVIFKIGPRINASGRMQSGMEAVELLTTRDINEAYTCARNIDQYNKDRKELDKVITDEANEIIAARPDLREKKAIVIYNKNWHKGIIGIVASRLTEIYYKPSVVLTFADGIATGSSRSVQGYDIYKAIDSSRELLENFGGHTYAVGLSLKEENIPEFTRRFEEYVAKTIEPRQLVHQQDIDTDITFAEITGDLISYLKQFNPYGPSNNKPIFLTRGVRDAGSSKLVGKTMEHIKLDIKDGTSERVFNGIAFNQADKFERIKAGELFDICYTLEENKHKGNTSLQLHVRDILFPPDK